MSFAVVHSRALDALHAQPVTVEVHLANGLPSFTLVGLADTEVKESRERCPSGIEAVGIRPRRATLHRCKQTCRAHGAGSSR
jgi:magnesium chelatase family protein